MEALGLSSAAAGLISLGLTICSGLLDYYYSYKDAENQVAQMYASIEALTETFRLLESAIEPKIFSRGSVQKIEQSISSAESGLQSLHRKLDEIRLTPLQSGWKAKGMAQLRRTVFPFKDSTLAKLKELGIELRQDLSLALEVLQIECSATSLQKLELIVDRMAKVSLGVDKLQEQSDFISESVQNIRVSSLNTSQSVDGLVATQSKGYQRKVYSWFSPLTMEFQKKHLDTFNTLGRQDGAAQSLLETTEFRHWLGASGETLWCPGMQGTGKTVFASYVINHLQGIVDQRESHLSYIYLSYKDAEKQNISNLLTNLICQLAFSEPVLSAALVASYEAHGSGATRPSHIECTQLLSSVVDRCPKVFLVIDAFDEYPEERRGQLLAELQRLQPNVSTMITSRDLPNIGIQLSRAIRLNVQAKSDDILQYLRGQIASSERLKSHTDRDPTLCDLISTTIAARAGGMFLQARLHLEFLTTKTTLRKLKDALTALPESLNDTYDKTMERINSQYPDQVTLARKVLCWLFNAYQPLTMLEVQHAVAVEIGDQSLDDDNIPEEELLLSVCNGLVTYQKESGFLGLVHYTFQQYLERKADSLFQEAQIEIVRTCLTYLSFDEFGQGPCWDDQRFEIRLQRYPLLRYAASNWGLHALAGAEEACSKLIFSFLSQSAKLSASVQVLAVRKSMGVNYTRRFATRVSALGLASYFELEYSMSQILAVQGSNVNAKTSTGATPLHQAAVCRHVGILKLLLNNGADVNARDDTGYTPLHYGAAWPDCLSNLNGVASVPAENRVWAEKRRKWPDTSVEVARLLLEHGSDVNATSLVGNTALHLSVRAGEEPLTRILLARGADVLLKDAFQTAPLTRATMWPHEGLVQLIMNYDLPRQIQYGIFNEAMRVAASRGHTSLLKILFPESSKQAPPDSETTTLLHVSAHGRLQCLQYLENQGFDLRALDEQKRTCLHHAATNSNPCSDEVIEYLLDGGLDPVQTDVDGWTPLHWAAKAGHATNINKLLDAGAGCDYQNDGEWVPFVIATYHNNSSAATILRPLHKPLPDLLRTQKLPISMQHIDIMCDGCQLDIVGSRYKCSVCPDFDYCFKCMMSAAVTHPSHRFKAVYWNVFNQDIEKMEQPDLMKKLTLWETFMKNGKV